MSELIPKTLVSALPPQAQVQAKVHAESSLLPATVTQSPLSNTDESSGTDKQSAIRLALQSAQYPLAAQSKLTLALNQNSSQLQVMLSSEDAKSLAQGQTQAKLILLGQNIQILLPDSLRALANTNGVSDQQLQLLAQRIQGYPLGITQSEGKQLSFDNGTSIKLDNKLLLPKGEYVANIGMQGKQLVLKLTAVQGEITVQLAPKTPASAPASNSQILLTKNEPIQILTQWLKKLENTPFIVATEAGKIANSPTPALSKQAELTLGTETSTQQGVKASIGETSTNKPTAVTSNMLKASQLLAPSSLVPSKEAAKPIDLTNSQSGPLPKGNVELAPMDVLQKALSKSGAMPAGTKSSVNEVNNVASQLLKSLPQLATMPLSQYAQPQLLQSQLTSFNTLNLASNPLTSQSAFTGEAVTTLFQLLLGFKASTSGQALSNKLAKHLQQLTLGMQLKMTQGLLAALDKGASLDSMAQLASSLVLYQQASMDPNQNPTWYFALPYSINQRDEQLEGKFERDEDNEQEAELTGWRLQLKFNLSQGSLLINAQRQGKFLGLKFTGNNEALLQRITQFQSPLSQKMAQIGFELNDFSTQIGTVPATLLPGDHYLVKTRA
ncbi:conserved hypothetical protein [Shewanella denitrificans OS217]|jgi:hypothetical protein|uniref:Flagellar hook-length control protein-like C-terminal domain-containing protein n=1 Tax=Shewanella denitrificans (strain OS217 / ATCC BAA-1090 / DSM 15013) TaxID=318161 RepID=Q12PI6_SHEDO|nr:hypothetical protein [Shewanella denitrificans]ABE54640.1 conserved hypothetical protein [Shewanella denitrificans OS217]